jgi:hypothetical protein
MLLAEGQVQTEYQTQSKTAWQDDTMNPKVTTAAVRN